MRTNIIMPNCFCIESEGVGESCLVDGIDSWVVAMGSRVFHLYRGEGVFITIIP